eukprot:1287560-Pleurochrysis_carterae.AAC.1
MLGCNAAILAGIDRDCRRRNQPLDTGFTKAGLMAVANDPVDGKLCSVDMYEKHAVEATANGPFGYDGWAGVHKSLIKPAPPASQLLREYKERGQRTSGVHFALTEEGRVLAERLHREYELLGYCSCGKVPKALYAMRPPPSKKRRMEEDHGFGSQGASEPASQDGTLGDGVDQGGAGCASGGPKPPLGLWRDRLPTLQVIIDGQREDGAAQLRFYE